MRARIVLRLNQGFEKKLTLNYELLDYETKYVA